MRKQPAPRAKALDPGPRIGDAFVRRIMRSLAAVLLVAAVANGAPAQEDRAAYEAGLATITAADLNQHLRQLASPELEGRDTPSVGLQRAAHYIAGVLDREAAFSGLVNLLEAADFQPGDRVRTMKGSLRGTVVRVQNDGKIVWQPDGDKPELTSLPESLLRQRRSK